MHSRFLNDPAPTEIYPLSLHDALPISCRSASGLQWRRGARRHPCRSRRDRKSTRLNSSHLGISYALFFFEKKINTRHANGNSRGGELLAEGRSAKARR